MSGSAGWPRVPIQNLYEGLYDGPHATPPPASDGPVFLGIGNITEDGHLDLTDTRHIDEADFPLWTRRVLPRAGDIVFTYEATLNRYAMIPEDFRGCLGRRLALIRPDPAKVDPQFLFYSFFAPSWRATIAENTLSGSTVDRIPLTRFPGFEVPVPPMPIQRRIVDLLAAHDGMIAINQRRVALLERMARLLYREWFVRYRFPGYEAAARIVSEIGVIPGGWEVRAVGEVARVVRGRSYRGDQLVDHGGVPFVNLKCVSRGGGFRQSGLKRYLGPASPPQYVEHGDVVVAVTDMTTDRGIVAQPARVPIMDDGPGVISMDLVKLVPEPTYSREYIYAALRDSGFAEAVREHANGTNVLHLSIEQIRNYPLAVPPIELRDRYSDIAGGLYRLAETLDASNARLRTMRDLMLRRLMAGDADANCLFGPSVSIEASG